MEVDKYNLEGGIRAMRQAALWLTQWADDLEKADRAGGPRPTGFNQRSLC